MSQVRGKEEGDRAAKGGRKGLKASDQDPKEFNTNLAARAGWALLLGIKTRHGSESIQRDKGHG